MSLDNIQLPHFVLQSLFKNNLIDIKNNEPVTNEPSSAPIAHLGNNKKNIVIIITNPQSIYLPDEDLNFLLGILSACKLSMVDIALVNLSKNEFINYKLITQEFEAQKILLFGVAPNEIELPLQFPHYQIQQYNNQTYLTSVPLSDLQKDKEEKLKLWNSLKKIFLIG